MTKEEKKDAGKMSWKTQKIGKTPQLPIFQKKKKNQFGKLQL